MTRSKPSPRASYAASRACSRSRTPTWTTDPPDVDDFAIAHAEAVQLPLARAAATRSSASRRRTALVDGFSLHANTVVDANDRAGLERLCRYVLRPLISADHLAVRSDGRIEYTFKRPDPTGRTSWVTDGPTWVRRLATLLPPRRSHTTRFHGVFGPAHSLRVRIVPAPSPTGDGDGQAAPQTSIIHLARRLDWAALLRRVFGDDVTRCPRCGDHLRILAFVTEPNATTAILEHLGVHSDVPRLAPARAPPAHAQSELDLGC